MDRGIHLCFFLFLSFALPVFGRDKGYELYVGGKDGWVTNPSESYSSWAGRLRFSVNDSLVFVYDKAVDSVLEVTSPDYSSCNAASPIKKLNTGRDFFKFQRSGPFYFISGNASHCQAGQKLIVVVLAVRSPPSPAPPVFTPPSAPGSAPPGAAPRFSPAPAVVAPPTAPGSNPPGVPPASTPPVMAPAPGSTSPATAPARGSTPPGVVPTPGSTPPTMAPVSGATPPVTVPAPGSIPPVKAPAPGSTSPVTPSAPGSTPRVTPAPGRTSPPGSGGSAPSPPPAPGSGSGPQTVVSPATAPSGSSGSPHLGPSSFPAILVAVALALLGGALIQ